MLECLSQVMTEVIKFTNRHSIDAKIHVHSVSELRGDNEIPDDFWKKFETYGGVYCFFSENQNEIKYIGMSCSSTGNRLSRWLFTTKSSETDLTRSLVPNDFILSIVLADEPYMAPSLEKFLLVKFETSFNAR